MTINALAWAWRQQKLPPLQKLALIVIADGTERTAKIARFCNVPEIDTECALTELREKGLIVGPDSSGYWQLAPTVTASLYASHSKDRPYHAHGRPTYIYFAKAEDGRVKIGVSNSVGNRIRSIQMAAGIALRLLHDEPGTYEDEQALFTRFAKQRLHGEWFRWCDEIEAYIDERILERTACAQTRF